jgi:hypothetical protein
LYLDDYGRRDTSLSVYLARDDNGLREVESGSLSAALGRFVWAFSLTGVPEYARCGLFIGVAARLAAAAFASSGAWNPHGRRICGDPCTGEALEEGEFESGKPNWVAARADRFVWAFSLTPLVAGDAMLRKYPGELESVLASSPALGGVKLDRPKRFLPGFVADSNSASAVSSRCNRFAFA